MNYIDAIVVIISVVEFIFQSGGTSAYSAFRAIRVFKLIRVIRIARLFRYLQSMNHILSIMAKSLPKFAYVIVLLILCIIVYSLLGMQLYHQKLNFIRQSRANFDNFYWAFLAIFQVLSLNY